MGVAGEGEGGVTFDEPLSTTRLEELGAFGLDGLDGGDVGHSRRQKRQHRGEHLAGRAVRQRGAFAFLLVLGAYCLAARE